MRNEQVIEVLEAKLSGFKAEIKAGNDMTTYKLDQLIEYQEKQNSRISTLENETRVFRLIHRNPTLSFTFIGLSVLGVIALFVLKNYIL